uniref:Uncharacterized protein n=1 Tax=Arundo donax TaxID=35708 RepID=A0A0A9C0L1_ARUDO
MQKKKRNSLISLFLHIVQYFSFLLHLVQVFIAPQILYDNTR